MFFIRDQVTTTIMIMVMDMDMDIATDTLTVMKRKLILVNQNLPLNHKKLLPLKTQRISMLMPLIFTLLVICF